MTQGQISIENWVDDARWQQAVDLSAQQAASNESRLELSLDAMVHMGRLGAQQAERLRAALREVRAELVRACAEKFEEEARLAAPGLQLERLILTTSQGAVPAWSLHDPHRAEDGSNQPLTVIGSLPRRLLGQDGATTPAWQRESEHLAECCAQTALEAVLHEARQVARRVVDEGRDQVRLQVINAVVLSETRSLQQREDYGQIVDGLVREQMGYQATAHG